MTDLDKRFNLVDEATPLNEFLSAHYKRYNLKLEIRFSIYTISPFSFRGFAYFTIRDRLPVILTTIIDNLSRDKEILIAEYGEVKCLVGINQNTKFFFPRTAGTI